MKKIVIVILLFLPLMGLALKTLPTFNFDHIILPTAPHFYLVCPKEKCDNKQNETSPVFDVSRDKLEQAWLALRFTLPRTRQVAHDKELHQYLYIQRSKMFHFPDYVFLRFVALADNKSSIMMYSYSRYGHYDFGVNKNRLQQWLKLLSDKVKQ